ncbi:Acetyl-CoA carboxylase 1 [Camellia lanceoleosa]|uniref:Acetyl-CoA carboxylase 1 n=1 Tax=Camellia lanceoleosa TaxID=1840588 RepID=A0ACC0GDU0_9ERIC|nr:Acetyl-CoA carboxylase 1 [Camellia lanceoleosa]
MEHGRGYDAWRKTSVFATPFDFGKAESTRPKGHCVVVRVTSVDPDDGFKPTSGKVQKASTSSATMVLEYVGYLEKGQIPPKHISLINSQVSLNIEGSKYKLDGNSHVIYAEEEAAGTRLLIDGRTCLLQMLEGFLIFKLFHMLENPSCVYEEEPVVAYALVEVISAADLKPSDLNGLADSYVKLGPYRLRTDRK